MRKRPEYVSIGMIARAHGVKGEVVAVPSTDDLQQFEKLKQVFVKDQQGERKLFAIERVRVISERIIIKFESIDNRDSALQLRGLFIDKRSDECEALPPDEYYIFDLIGLKVKTTDHVWLGEITDVLTLPANDIYVVHDGVREYLIPAIKDVIKKIDLEGEHILIEPIDGLL